MASPPSPPGHSLCYITIRYHDGMVRTQIQLREDQYEALKRRAVREDRSLADLVRESLDRWLFRSPSSDALAGLEELSGSFRDQAGADDVAQHHDRYLAEPHGR